MASRRQLKAAKERERRAQEKQREEEKLASSWSGIKNMPSGFQRSTLQGSGMLRDKSFRREVLINESGAKHTPREERRAVFDEERAEEMREREALAQQEIERKKTRVAIVCHKSSYQYITEGMDPKLFGRK